MTKHLRVYKTTVSLNGHTIEITFYGIKTSRGKQYFASAEGQDGHSVFHVWKNDDGKWTILTDAPKWISQAQEQICEIVQSIEIEGENS